MDAALDPHLLLQGLAIGVLTGILYVLVALGLTLIYGILHIVNFAHGEIYMLGAMAVFYFYVVFGLPFALTLLLILLLSVAFGLLTDRAFFRPAPGPVAPARGGERRHLAGDPVGRLDRLRHPGKERAVLPARRGGAGRGAPAARAPPRRPVGLVLVAGLYWLVYRTRVGLAMRAIEEDEETARMLGINADRVAAVAVALGFALAAVAGAFVAPIYSLNPGMGLEPILMSFLIIIVGGLGSITGTVLAGLLVGVLQSVGAVAFGAEAAYGLVFVVMIAVLVARPAGLLGKT